MSEGNPPLKKTETEELEIRVAEIKRMLKKNEAARSEDAKSGVDVVEIVFEDGVVRHIHRDGTRCVVSARALLEHKTR